MEKNINSILVMDRLVFDEIKFERTGFKNDESKFDFNIEVMIGVNSKSNKYKVTLKLLGKKEKEYNLNITLTGFFSIDEEEQREDEFAKELINKNAVAIMMPYLRSQISLITAQPDVEVVLLPPFNINSMLSD